MELWVKRLGIVQYLTKYSARHDAGASSARSSTYPIGRQPASIASSTQLIGKVRIRRSAGPSRRTVWKESSTTRAAADLCMERMTREAIHAEPSSAGRPTMLKWVHGSWCYKSDFHLCAGWRSRMLGNDVNCGIVRSAVERSGASQP